jgi:hypothetical protein
MTARRKTALHEAAHAVIARRLGCRVLKASIEPDGDAQGICSYLPPSGFSPTSQIAVHVGGQLAVEHATPTGGIDARTLADDLTQSVLSGLDAQAAGDAGAMDRGRWVAGQLILQNWPAIIRLASALERHGTIEEELLPYFMQP